MKKSQTSELIEKSFDILKLDKFFTAGEKECRAWTINKNSLLPKAGAVIHTDFERGFICAEVVSYEDFVKFGGYKNAKENGKIRIEGKSYITKDGDIINFRFNV